MRCAELSRKGKLVKERHLVISTSSKNVVLIKKEKNTCHRSDMDNNHRCKSGIRLKE
jgi:hypothetical protein